MAYTRSDLKEYKDRRKTGFSIILDIDETLLNASDNMQMYSKIISEPKYKSVLDRIFTIDLIDATKHRGTGEKYRMWYATRPHLHQFLSFCFDYFDNVIIWSAGRKKYVNEVVYKTFFNLPAPDIIYSYFDCRNSSNGTHLIKPISEIIKENPEFNIDPAKTIVLDDRSSTFDNNKGNGIQIPIFKINQPDDLFKDDPSLLVVMDWLKRNDVRNAKDVRSIPKDKLFGGKLLPYR